MTNHQMMSEARDEKNDTTIARPMKNSVAADVEKIGASVRRSGRRSRTPAPEEHRGRAEEDEAGSEDCNGADHVACGLRVPDGQEVVRAPVAVRRPRRRCRSSARRARGSTPSRRSHRRASSPDSPLGNAKQGMHEDRDAEAAEDLPEREEVLVARLGERSEHEREADDDHERPEPVPRSARPRDEAGRDERPDDDEVHAPR